MTQGTHRHPFRGCLGTVFALLLLAGAVTPAVANVTSDADGVARAYVSGEFQDESLSPVLEFVEDMLHRQPPDVDPETLHALPWRPADASLSRGGVSRSQWFLRVPLRNLDAVPRERVLMVMHATLDDVRLHFRCSDGSRLHMVSGDSHPLSKRVLPDRYPAFPVTLPPNASCTAWFVVNSQDAFLFPARIVDDRRYNRVILQDYLLHGLALGMQLLAAAMGVAIALYRRDALAWHYSAAVTSQALLVLVLSDLGYILLWGEMPGVQRMLAATAIPLCWVLTAQLCMRLLPQDAVHWSLRGVVQGCLLLACGAALMQLFMPDPRHMALLVASCAVGMVLVLAITGGAVLLGAAHAGLVSGGIVVITVGGLIEASGYLAVLPLGIFYLVPLQAGFLLSGLLFGLALWARVVDTQQRRGADREVDRRVVERTRALSSTVAELTSVNRRLDHLSRSDVLTGTYNRRFMDLCLQRDALDEKQMPLSFILFDIDFFKQVNDRHGHPAGDRCLRVVADCVQRQLRQHTDLLCRYGGEEFAVILPGTDAEGARRVAEKIRIAVENVSVRCDRGVELHVTVSLGIATLREAGDPTPLIASADAALYEAKRGGRNRWRMATA